MMRSRIFLIFFVVFSAFLNAGAQPPVSFHIDQKLFGGKNIIKIQCTDDNYAWVIGENNFVARINPDRTIDDFTAKAATVSTTKFVDIACSGRDEALIGTAGDYVVKLKNGIASRLGPAQGITEGNIVSVVFNHVPFLDIFNGLSSIWTPGTYSITSPSNLYYSADLNSFSVIKNSTVQPVVLARGFLDITRKEIILGDYLSADNHYCFSTSNYNTLMYHTSKAGLFRRDLNVHVGDFRDIRTSLATVRTTIESFFSGGGIMVWAGKKGMTSYRVESCQNPILYQYLPNEEVNKFVELNFLTQFAGQMLTYIIAGTSSGLFISNDNLYWSDDKGYSKVPNMDGIHINDMYGYNIGKVPMKYDTSDDFCEKQLYVASTDGVYILSYSLTPTALSALSKNISFDPAKSDNKTDEITICGGGSIKLNTLAPQTANLQWQKNGVDIPGAKSNAYTATGPGKYRVLLHSICENIAVYTKELTVKEELQPQVSFSYPDEISLCEGSTIVLSTIANSNYIYQWTKNGSQIQGTDSSSYTVSAAGVYSVKVSNCSGTFISSKNVEVKYIKVTKPVIQADKASYCEGDQAVLSVTADPAARIQWYLNNNIIAGATTATLSVKRGGAYKVQITSGICSAVSDGFNLQFNALPDFVIEKSVSQAICYGQTAILKVSGSNSSYKWNTGETTPSITVSSSGTYEVTVFNTSGCSSTRSVTLAVFPPIDLAILPDLTLCSYIKESKQVSAQEGFRFYTWDGVRGTSNTIEITGIGTHTLLVEDNYGCTKATTFNVKVFCKELIIPNTFTPNGDGINDVWNIAGLESDADCIITVYNRNGSQVYHSVGYQTKWDGTMNGSRLSTGSYYYVIKTRQSPNLLNGPISILR